MKYFLPATYTQIHTHMCVCNMYFTINICKYFCTLVIDYLVDRQAIGKHI